MNASHNSVDLEQMFPRGMDSYLAGGDDLRLGVVVGGSLRKGLAVKLDPRQTIEDWRSGAMWWYMGENNRFFCMITDVALNSTNPAIQNDPPESPTRSRRRFTSARSRMARSTSPPMLSIDGMPQRRPPVKTIPGHFMPVYQRVGRRCQRGVRRRRTTPTFMWVRRWNWKDAGQPRSEAAGGTLGRCVRQERHRQDLSHARAAGGGDRKDRP